MIKSFKLPDNILDLIHAVENCLSTQPKVVFAYLFGSLAGGSPKPLSDVDIAVFFNDCKNFSETCVDVAGHIISDQWFRIPKSYSDTFSVIHENNILDDWPYSSLKKNGTIQKCCCPSI